MQNNIISTTAILVIRIVIYTFLQRYGRKYPMIGMADHLSECTADPKERKAQQQPSTKQVSRVDVTM